MQFSLPLLQQGKIKEQERGIEENKKKHARNAPKRINKRKIVLKRCKKCIETIHAYWHKAYQTNKKQNGALILACKWKIQKKKQNKKMR